MLTSILLQATEGQGGLIGNLILIGGIALIFYFFMIRPQQKKQKDQRNFISAVKKGDMVVTVGGVHGKVISVEDDTFILEVDRGAKIKFEKSSISLESSKKYATNS
ncbi:preprotein translocase subunit YajC [Catalinimonas alkaloidigena]|uniref:preprotein translocase subunit YajC n=1 Tax=Catalinimonas alkaloidigena TaxID=1075417 RepID=UPI002404FB93|nr:preprotein translocase subunit YajC [Catalinimonas alkaloidigena]MDF9801028.1 preprotein translocase subunit YajC [Catalinimonas alkaloidigena]